MKKFSWILVLAAFLSVSINFKISISLLNPVAVAAGESAQTDEAKLASSLPRSSTTQSEETPKAATPAPSPLVENAAKDESIERKPRAVTYLDLLNINDVGVSSAMDFDGIALSPDERFIAIETIRESVDRNALESRWLVLSLAEPVGVRDIGVGPDLLATQDIGLRVGVRLVERPVWLPDSQGIAFRSSYGGRVQIWYVSRDGRTRLPLTHAQSDVSTFRLSRDGKRLLYTTANNNLELISESEEAFRGFLYDQRFAPQVSREPIVAGLQAQARAVWVYELSQKTVRLASVAEQQELDSIISAAEPKDGRQWFRPALATDAAVWLQPRRDRRQTLDASTVAAQKEGRVWVCEHEQCSGYFKGLWIDKNGRTVYFVRWTNGYDYGTTALYSWEVGANAPIEILRSDDLLQACVFRQTHLICVQESHTKPTHIVTVELQSGARKTLYDPNVAFDFLKFGDVTPFNWQDDGGIQGFGHLVKPIGFEPGKRYPLIIVQYRSRGFLRGGVGNEFPIQVFASKGFAVLSFHRPVDWETLSNVSDPQQRERMLWRNLRDRGRVLSVLRAGIRKLDHDGIIDPSRVGITGLSDGANTATYALIHAPIDFAAASVAWTHWNPILFYLAGPLSQPTLQSFGLDDPTAEASKKQWQRLSISLNARSIRAPILIQVADSELLPETETVASLKRFDKPVEMHVFPNETHVKTQPLHRLSVYRRNVQWFQFWLQHLEDPEPVDVDQYPRWRTLRQQHERDLRSNLNYAGNAQTSVPLTQ